MSEIGISNLVERGGHVSTPAVPAQVAVIHHAAMPTVVPVRFTFDGGLASYIGVWLVAMLVTICTLGVCLPWAVCKTYGWRTNHTLINGQRLRFTGTGMGLFGQWIKWFLLTIVTLGIYSFWVKVKITKWCVEHQELRSN